jgi:flagellin-like hook-associated protein FlgL
VQGIATSAMATRIATAVAGLGGGNAASVLAETAAAATDTSAAGSVFSGFLEDPAQGGSEARRSLMAGDGEVVAYGLFANRNAVATSDGDATVGAWSRDLLRGLATLAALTPAQAEEGADYEALIGAVREGLRSAHDALGVEAGALGLVEARLEQSRKQQETLTVALTKQLGEAEEVDLASVLTEMQELQARLEASYRAIAMLSGLTLTQFLR